MAIGAAAAGLRTRKAGARECDGDRVVQVIHESKLYMTHYAFFDEPDPNVPAAIYFDAATGQETHELELSSPLSKRHFRRNRHGELHGPGETSKLLPYFVDPPGFPPTPAPPEIVGFIQQVTGLPTEIVQAGSQILLVAIGQFLDQGEVTARLQGHRFEVQKQMRFEVRVRIGFLFTPPPGVPAPSVGVLTGFLTLGIIHQLIQLPPPPDPNLIVVYDWTAPMTLSTETNFIRTFATEPPPVADPFPSTKKLRLEGSRVDDDGHYTIVGNAAPSQVQFIAPPELELFLFGTTSLTDVEFAVLERGRIIRDDD